MLRLLLRRFDFHSTLFLAGSFLVPVAALGGGLPGQGSAIPAFTCAALCLAVLGIIAGLRSRYEPRNWRWMGALGAYFNFFLAATWILVLSPDMFRSTAATVQYVGPVGLSIICGRFLYS